MDKVGGTQIGYSTFFYRNSCFYTTPNFADAKIHRAGTQPVLMRPEAPNRCQKEGME
jgi:hypothetical protein